MTGELLTARGLYSLLTTGMGSMRGHASFLAGTTAFTQSRFWGTFLSECVEDWIVNQYFLTAEKRSRSLSNIMNRTCTHSMPVRLYNALQASLDDDNLVCMTVWTAASLEQSINPMALHNALTEYEERVLQTDPWLEQIRPFVLRLRPDVKKNGSYHLKKLFLQAALRVTVLGLHALYGDRMLESIALKKLRISQICGIDLLWKQAVSVAPRIEGADFSFQHAAERYKAVQPLQRCHCNAQIAADRLASMLPEGPMMTCIDPATCGWYAVANWMDMRVSVNDTPMPTYEGARRLAEISNGTVVFVLAAVGYKGLHVSKGVWGKIIWKGAIAWVPMNLMVRLDMDAALKTSGEGER